MASIGDTTRPAFAYDSATDTWVPVGVGPHSHTPAAIGAISNSLTTTTGDMIYAASANTPARLAIGTTGQVLTVSGGVPAWGSASAAPTSYALLNSGSTTLPTNVSSITFTGLGGYNNYYVYLNEIASASSNAFMQLRINASSAANYNNYGWNYTNSSSFSATNLDQIRDTNATTIVFSKAAGTQGISGGINIQGGNSTGAKMYEIQSGGTGDGARAFNINGYWANTATISSLQLYTSSGNFSYGFVYIYGGN